MRRRVFVRAGVATLGAAVLPRGGQAQQIAPVVGFLGSASRAQWTRRIRAFGQGLEEQGFVEGKNLRLEYRWADGHNDRLPELAADLVARKVAAIAVLGNTASAFAARDATTSIPIVFRIAASPVEVGLVRSLNRPGGNITGVTTLGIEAGPKQLGLLHELVSAGHLFGLLVNPTNNPAAAILAKTVPEAARALGLEVRVLQAKGDDDLGPIFDTLVKAKASGLSIASDSFFNSRNERLAELAVRYSVPTISPSREFAEAGGLMSYGASITEASHQAGVYLGRILKGEKPGDLPVEQPTKLEFVINLRAANTLRLTVLPTLLARADEVIE